MNNVIEFQSKRNQHYHVKYYSKSNRGNKGYSGNQQNVIHGQRPDMENKHTQQRA